MHWLLVMVVILLLYSYVGMCAWSADHCCLLFFFFKQKTAYEMRISDWSSDVCSSDLPRRGRSRRRRSTGSASRDGNRLAGPRCPAATSIRPKIGRASCRERVCQYV